VIFTFLFKKKKNGAYAISNRLRKYIFASPLTTSPSAYAEFAGSKKKSQD
jgi:hypothetical protein